MVGEPGSIVPRYLRGIDQKVDRLVADMGDLKGPVTNLETGGAGVEMSIAGVLSRIDRVEQRLDRIERRLDLVDDSHGGVREQCR